MNSITSIFNINSEKEFNTVSLEIFNFQWTNNPIYQQFCNYLKINPQEIKSIEQIPFLPIEFFKSHPIKTGIFEPEQVFLSSGTTGMTPSKHFVKAIELYEISFTKAFQQFYGNIEDYCVLALLPSYLEREGSSLVYMVEQLIQLSKHPKSGFFLKNEQKLVKNLQKLIKNEQKTLLIGVSFALLDLAERYQLDLSQLIIMETGGMKGRREELTRSELHGIYKKSFNVSEIHSEYGMTELLSQAYSKGNGIFTTPNWMKIVVRDINDPLSSVENNKTGGINVIDLANIYSCSFIATQDLGKKITANEFEVLGRFDNSDIRGCNLLVI
ncbi:MAG: acyl transferase [Flavobacteriales bacterium CG_4_10_14_0_2_um_filter_32_8]|nr:MAG: acyl transferase [Flavobacteriales bacterium CG_4_10_14_0_2_um_filter_32_8]PJB14155.1 MAG: acyl transferase [Flavobacteriales bacterium CG_4_9_14_3_um_filter_32_8]